MLKGERENTERESKKGVCGSVGGMEEGGSVSAGEKKGGGEAGGERERREGSGRERRGWGWYGDPRVSQSITRQSLPTSLGRAGRLEI